MENSNVFTDPEKLFIRVHGYASEAHKAERAVMTVQISSETSSKDQSFDDIAKTSKALQDLVKSLQAEPDASGNAQHSGSSQAPLTEWSMGRVVTHSFLPAEISSRLSPNRNGSLFAPHQQFGQSNAASHITAEEAEQYRRYSAKTHITMKFQDFLVLSSVASKVARTPFAELINISWQLTVETNLAAEKQVRKLAVKSAVEKANDFAEAALGKRTAKMTYVDDSGAQPTGGGGGVFGASGFGSSTANNMTAQATPAKEEISLEPANITVCWRVSGQFVA